MKNSIEEDIKILEEMIENANIENMDMNDCFGGEHIEAIEHILSAYKRGLKENEELKQEKINNYRMIALAQNEALGYMQGYEDGKKLKTSAIASIVENQQYYIIKKQMEKYEEHIAKLQKENEELKKSKITYEKVRDIQEKNKNIVDNNYIPKQKAKDKIEELKKNLHTVEHYETVGAIHALQELIEERKLEEDKL